jgi:replicative DNA helicase
MSTYIERLIDRMKPEEREEALSELLELAIPKEYKPAGFIGVAETIEAAKKYRAEEGKLNGLSTGYKDLDAWTGGMSPGQVILVFADTGIGKSLLVQNIAINVAKTNRAVVFAGLEMTDEENTDRFISMTSETLVQQLPIAYPDENQDLSLNGLDSFYRSSAERGARLVIIDHLHAMKLPQASSDASAYEALIWEIKRASVRHKVPTLLGAQVSYSFKGKRGFPDLNDIKGSSAIQQCADVAIALKRDKEKDAQTLHLQLAKIRSREHTMQRTSLQLMSTSRLKDEVPMFGSSLS